MDREGWGGEAVGEGGVSGGNVREDSAKNKTKIGRVFLVGAGCGRADLITLRGLNLLKDCDAVVYDDLIDRELLMAVPGTAECFYMGKRQGRHGASQEEICEALIRLAREGKRVVRLKGGDPYVFGRGGEEMMALLAAGIPCEEVPGVSSAIAIPAEAGIPVTHRGLSQSLHIITGHTALGKEGLPEDLERLAGLNGTLVFLMGLSRLERLAGRLMAGGKSPDTPAAVLSGGCAPSRQEVRGTLGNIAEKAKKAGVLPPAVIVIGQTASLALKGAGTRPLDGIRAGITGTPAITGKLRSLLEGLGAQVHTVMELQAVPLPLPESMEALWDGTPRFLVFTSANGAEIFFEFLRERKADLRRLAACRFAVIGPSTGEALKRHGIVPDLCPKIHTSRGLALALAEAVRHGKKKAAGGGPGEKNRAGSMPEDIVLLRSEQGARILPQILQENGLSVRDVPLYRLERGRTAEELPALDWLLFSSAGGVEQFFARYGALPEGARCLCIGEVTAKRLADFVPEPPLTARTPSAQAMAEALCREVMGGSYK